MFLGFVNFYKMFIRNFNKIAVLLTSMLQITDKLTRNEAQSTWAEKQDIPSGTSGIGSTGDTGEGIKNLLTGAKSIKSKKPDLLKANFAKNNSFGTDFLAFKAKKAFMHLQKAFTKAPILRHFDSEYHIHIKIDTSGYAIGRILSQMTLDQHFSGHMTYKGPNSEIGQ